MDEFTDTYSDDLIVLREARVALLTHPMRGELPDPTNASFCRMYAIIMIGSIEAMLERWKERDNLNILDAYFSPPQNASNRDRINSLVNAFACQGLTVNRDVFDDYLAIKYLRNAIVHASWAQGGKIKEEQIKWIESRGFIADARDLTVQHLQKMEWVNQNMMFLIASTSLASLAQVNGQRRLRSDLSVPSLPIQPAPVTHGVVQANQWASMHWRNLERISTLLGDAIERAAVSAEYNWAKDLSLHTLNSMPDKKKKYRFYLAARNAARQGFEGLTNMGELAGDALFSWTEFKRLSLGFETLDMGTLKRAVKTFDELRKLKVIPKGGFMPEVLPENDDGCKEIVSALLGDISPLTWRQIVEANNCGAKSYRLIRNISALSLFAVQLPIVAPTNIKLWKEISEYIACVFSVGRSWHYLVEGFLDRPDPTRFYRGISRVIAKLES